MRGPPPTPTRILEARGSWRADLRTDEPVVAVEIPPCPAWLDKTAREEWNRVTSEMFAAKTISQLDMGEVANYCACYSRLIGFSRSMRRMSKAKAWRMASNVRAEAQLLSRIGAQLGLTPASRARVTVGEAKKHKETKGKGRFFGA